jgi:hypothetical protein
VIPLLGGLFGRMGSVGVLLGFKWLYWLISLCYRLQVKAHIWTNWRHGTLASDSPEGYRQLMARYSRRGIQSMHVLGNYDEGIDIDIVCSILCPSANED